MFSPGNIEAGIQLEPAYNKSKILDNTFEEDRFPIDFEKEMSSFLRNIGVYQILNQVNGTEANFFLNDIYFGFSLFWTGHCYIV